MRIRERAAAKRMVERFAESVRTLQSLLTTDKSDLEPDAQQQQLRNAEQEHFEAKFELLTYIYRLGAK